MGVTRVAKRVAGVANEKPPLNYAGFYKMTVEMSYYLLKIIWQDSL